MPILESAITLIEEERLFYRGHDAITLARTEPVERVTALLWSGDLDADVLGATPVEPLPDVPVAGAEPLTRFQIALPLLATADLAAYDLRDDAVRRAAGVIMRAFTGIVAGRPWQDSTLAGALQHGLTPDNAAAERLLNAALIVCADHELNVSSFTVRCIASARAPLYAAVAGGLAALSGVRHGAASLQVESLLAEIGANGDPRAVIVQRLRRGEELPGFGHRLYPSGDPRAGLLLDLLTESLPSAPAVQLGQATIAAVHDVTGQAPNLEMGLVTLANGLDLPPGSALTLMALGRTIGWIAHAIEEYDRDTLIRPRARYVGEAPGRDSGLGIRGIER
jgi:citrate synthase